MQIIIHGKRQVGLPAAKIQDRKLPVLIKDRKDILDKLKETIDLAEFVESCMDDPSFRRHNSQVLKKWHRHVLFQNVLLLSVMA